MKHKSYLKIFRNLRNQLISFLLFALILLVMQVLLSASWLTYALGACMLYCVLLFIAMVVIWALDRRH
ncbi:MAG: hypothetical protein LKF36_06795 [Lactobacillus sp.]|jgi:uncharacterized membrane protein SirB2|nr:hypothetical protein [Lactobacillus sp.]